MEEAPETGVSHLVTPLAEVISKLAGSSCLVEQLMPALTHDLCKVGDGWVSAKKILSGLWAFSLDFAPCGHQ